MKIKGKKLIAGILLFVLAAAIGGMSFMLYKDRTYFHSPPYNHEKTASDVLVVYYSRSGNTEAFARELAREFGADILRIRENRYTLDFKGWREASRDAADKVRNVEIEPRTYDLKPYRIIFLGSPIWLFRPAPPLWAFVENNRLEGKSFVLFNTFNSRFKQENIDEFKKLIESKGGKFVDHIFIRRGRIIYQMNGRELLESAKKIARDKKRLSAP